MAPLGASAHQRWRTNDDSTGNTLVFAQNGEHLPVLIGIGLPGQDQWIRDRDCTGTDNTKLRHRRIAEIREHPFAPGKRCCQHGGAAAVGNDGELAPTPPHRTQHAFRRTKPFLGIVDTQKTGAGECRIEYVFPAVV